MKIAILCQEEPVFLGPFLQQVMRMHPERIAAVFVAGKRSAGERGRSLREFFDSMRIFWLIMEPLGFLKALALRIRAKILGAHDPRSVAGLAQKLGIPVHSVSNVNSAEFHALLRTVAPDLVLNQSECLLEASTLEIPKLGFVNRHASLLPQYRGRMACFWSHASLTPRYGLSIHFVDEDVDTGGLILQNEFLDVDPCWSYPQVMSHVCAKAPDLFWKAMSTLNDVGFGRSPQGKGERPRRFPTLADAKQYRLELSHRRRICSRV